MSKVCWLVVGLLVVGSHRQIPTWASDRAVWEQAARVSPTNVRPAVNIAAQHVVAQRWEEAQWWIAHARVLVRDPKRARERDAVLQILDRQETWISAFSSLR